MRAVLLLGLWVAATACGARSQLDRDDPLGIGGAGTVPASGGAGGMGTGGGGGQGGRPPMACTGLQVGLGPSYLEAPDPFFHTARPDLVGLEDDSVAWVTSLVPVESPGPAPHGIAHAKLSPWTGSALGATEPTLVAQVGGRSVVATETGRVGLYALGLAVEPPGPNADEMRVVRTVDPHVSYAPVPAGIQVVDDESEPELLVAMEDRLLFGWGIHSHPDGPSFLRLGRYRNVSNGNTTVESGCALGGIQAHAVEAHDGALIGATIALASGREPYACFDDDGIIGPPTRLQTGFVDGANLNLTVSEDEVLPEPILFLDVVGGPNRAWVIWQTDGSTSEQAPPVQARRLDATGTFAGPVIELTSGGYFPPYGVSAFGDGLAFVHIDAFDPGPPTLVLLVHDAEGERIAEASHPLPLGGFGSRFALRASPSRDALLIAWAEQGDADQANPTGFLRFDCVSR